MAKTPPERTDHELPELDDDFFAHARPAAEVMGAAFIDLARQPSGGAASNPRGGAMHGQAERERERDRQRLRDLLLEGARSKLGEPIQDGSLKLSRVLARRLRPRPDSKRK